MLHDKRIALGALGAVAVVAAVAAVPAFAKSPHGSSRGNSANAHGHVTICHATPPDTAAHGYVRISPSASGVYHGHLRQHSADIIPPFVYNGVTYSENWDATGQAIWNNGCVVPAASTTTGTTTTDTTTTGTTTTGTTTGGVAPAGSTTTATTTTGGVAGAKKTGSGAKGTDSGVKAVTHAAKPTHAATGGASFAG
jgi:hypothetical protein